MRIGAHLSFSCSWLRHGDARAPLPAASPESGSDSDGTTQQLVFAAIFGVSGDGFDSRGRVARPGNKMQTLNSS